MKRLFQVNKPDSSVVMMDSGRPYYFDSKPAAKKVRDALNKEHPDGGYTVAPGPDHHNYKG